MKTLIDSLACVALVLVAIEDMKRFRIRNFSIVALLILFCLGTMVSGDGPNFLWHAFFGFVALISMFGAFSLRLIGAGDAKLIAAGCLWVGPANAVPFAFVLFCLTALYAVCAKLRWLPVRRDQRQTKIPFGPSISGAWLFMIAFS